MQRADRLADRESPVVPENEELSGMIRSSRGGRDAPEPLTPGQREEYEVVVIGEEVEEEKHLDIAQVDLDLAGHDHRCVCIGNGTGDRVTDAGTVT